MRRAASLIFAAAFAAGLGLIRFGGWGLLPLGLLCIACGIGYTGGPYPLGYHGWGDLFVLIFFGLVAVGATYWVQAGSLPAEVWLAGAGVGLLAANILVANNYRDRATDAAAGKRTLVVRWGERAGRWQYGVAVAGSFLVPLLLWRRGFTAWVLLSWLAAPLAAQCVGELRPAAEPAVLIRLLAKSAAVLALYGVLLAVGVLLG
jgi:1,4-dihydroxy-2-naphthoate octaprenyltransferase